MKGNWNETAIDTGWEYWTVPGIDHMQYGTPEGARRAAQKEGIDESLVVYHDTRLTMGEVIEKIRKAENMACNIDPDDRFSIGPWDEYFSPSTPLKSKDYWPRGRVFVSVVRGGSEGTYLHIIVGDQFGSTTVVLGKTCAFALDAMTWKKCWESAMRISWYLTCS